MTDRSSGKITLKKSRIGPAPSMIAASSRSRGMVAMNARNSRMQNASPKAISMRMSPVKVLNSPRLCSTQMVGTTAGGMMSPDSTRKLTRPLQRLCRRCSHVGHHGGQHDQDGDADHGQDRCC